MMKAKTLKPTANLENTYVTFHGYDGKDYVAFVVRVRKGVAIINYRVPGHTAPVQAYISDASRFTL